MPFVTFTRDFDFFTSPTTIRAYKKWDKIDATKEGAIAAVAAGAAKPDPDAADPAPPSEAKAKSE